jgi:hypothetical protein
MRVSSAFSGSRARGPGRATSDTFCAAAVPVLEPARKRPTPNIRIGVGIVRANRTSGYATLAHSYSLQRIFARRSSKIVQQLLAPGPKIIRHLSLDRGRADARGCRLRSL